MNKKYVPPVAAVVIIAVTGTSPLVAADSAHRSFSKFTIKASAGSIDSGDAGALGGPATTVLAAKQPKLAMRFSWVPCQPNCRGWISAVGIVTADTPNEFEEFARGRELDGATIVLDSAGGSVNDAIALGRRWRNLGVLTTVGTSIDAQGEHAEIAPAYCESMCVFLLLSGKIRYVPDRAHVRVHQIWMGDRADNALAASYSAKDMMIVERDLGRLAKYTFEMGATGDLLSLALSVPPWEDLHELSPAELRLTHLVTTDAVAEVLPAGDSTASLEHATATTMQDWFESAAVNANEKIAATMPTKIDESTAHADAAAVASPAKRQR